MTPKLLFQYIFWGIMGVGCGILAVLFIAAMSKVDINELLETIFNRKK